MIIKGSQGRDHFSGEYINVLGRGRTNRDFYKLGLTETNIEVLFQGSWE